MSVQNDVTVTIDIQRPTPKLGFGKPLIIGSSASGMDYKSYSDLDAVKADFAESTEIYLAARALLSQGDNSPAEIAVMLYKTTGETLEDLIGKIFLKDWYFLISTSSTIANITTIADAIELNGTRMFFASSSNKANLATIKAKKYKRTAVIYHTTTDNYPEAAWISRVGTIQPGGVTWKFKTLQGIKPMDIDTTEMKAIHELGANTYVTKAGDDQTSEGMTVSGEYIDLIHSQDYITQSIEFAVQKLFNRSDKVSYDNNGIAQIEGEVKTILRRADLNRMIAHDDDGLPIYSTTFKPRSQVDPADREKREYNDGKFSFELAGAIHKTKISGVIKL
ncbi:DUF3383 family protein [Paenibacillus macquariensis]|uniref:DUF3383 family protein n=1 Tax=Paenibacillus macquariensis TaxID=948756 RepID=A0ABY1JS79_9BACL|nr:DUF3383 family protein [Paenibacillus macquariensis]MEC0092884.1 DUF3383 family protein [Paenibacillus macquariensis]OAB36257.1 hypothetical protein PMSM_07360 [Paenibacillus macquariensis subsp. macquariensis]SIQ68106.1 Protein of unknown function [Paenibacillus macquariensis]